MRSFDQWMTTHQLTWRAQHLKVKGDGAWMGKTYPWLLPRSQWQEGLWAGVKAPLLQHINANQIQVHGGVHNLKSSWVQCANTYFPFGQTSGGRKLLAGFLTSQLGIPIDSVDAMELEYAAPEGDKAHPARLLGEQGGSRGTGQTSPDIGITFNGGKGLLLVENKLVEHSFYQCSARLHKGNTERVGNPDSTRCLNCPTSILKDVPGQCHQSIWGRKYLDILKPAANKASWGKLSCCPAAHAGYQLLRQQALAEGIARSGRYETVISAVALDDRNDTLRGCLRSTGLADCRDWGQLFEGKAAFAVFTHQDWVAWVQRHDRSKTWDAWLDYVKARYAF